MWSFSHRARHDIKRKGEEPIEYQGKEVVLERWIGVEEKLSRLQEVWFGSKKLIQGSMTERCIFLKVFYCMSEKTDYVHFTRVL